MKVTSITIYADLYEYSGETFQAFRRFDLNRNNRSVLTALQMTSQTQEHDRDVASTPPTPMVPPVLSYSPLSFIDHRADRYRVVTSLQLSIRTKIGFAS